jgi:hypothetical protein
MARSYRDRGPVSRGCSHYERETEEIIGRNYGRKLLFEGFTVTVSKMKIYS